MLELRQVIKNLISIKQGVKAPELVVEVINTLIAEGQTTSFDSEEYQAVINALVESGDVVEMEYILPHMEYRVKSIFFPKGTKFPPRIRLVKNDSKSVS